MPNKLISEKSPYLQQHANNPVDWYPWSEEAFNRAKDEDKPIFLSIGYSTCYWCHVMEREVFEDPKIAETMNKLFVNIKVDREERPDVDRVYMSALQSMTGSGGWPMSMFLTSDLKPFYGATYVPPTAKFNLPGFEELIIQIYDAWMNRRDEVLNSGNKIIEHIINISASSPDKKELTNEPAKKAIEQFKQSYDNEYGGFGGAPKFPRPSGFNFLLRMYYNTKDDEILQKVVRSLTMMADGGVYDHLGGGFHRYSVDKFWRVPHFEKMLYDQAQLVTTYLETYQLTNEKFFLEIAEHILGYVDSNLKHPDGGFYSAEDAESALNINEPHNKEEGTFYVWEKSEIDNILGEDAKLFCYIYGVHENGNAPAGSDPHNVFMNKNILYRAQSSFDKAAEEFNMSKEDIKKVIVSSKEKLFSARLLRPRPILDDKILTSWNALMISAYALAYKITGNLEYLNTAMKSTEFILYNLHTVEGELLHRWRDNEAKLNGYLDDYAYFIQSLLDMYEVTFDIKYLETAKKLTDKMILIFYDTEEGGFFDVSDKDKSILYRSKDDYDSAEPSGNSIAVNDLIRLSEYFHEESLLDKAKSSLENFSDKIEQYPYSVPQMLCTLDYFINERKQIVISGYKDDKLIREMMNIINSKYIPSKITVLVEPDKTYSKTILDGWETYSGSRPTVYICRQFSCLAPITDIETLKETFEV